MTAKKVDLLVENYMDYLLDGNDEVFITESKLRILSDLTKKLVDSNFKTGAKIVSALVAGTGLGAIGGAVHSLIKPIRKGKPAEIMKSIFDKFESQKTDSNMNKMFGDAEKEVPKLDGVWSEFGAKMSKYLDPQHIKAGAAAGLLMGLMFVYLIVRKKKKKKEALQEVEQKVIEQAKETDNEETKEVLEKSSKAFSESVKSKLKL